MKNISFSELKALLSDAKDTEKKKAFYIAIGVFVTVAAIMAGIGIALMKRNCLGYDDEEYDEYWDDDEDYFDDEDEEIEE